MKPKEYLVSQGVIAHAGRGRLSAAHRALVQKAADNGVFIEGFSKTVNKVTVEKKSKTPKPKIDKEILEIAPFRYDEKAYRAVADDGTVYGMREVCMRCGVSLVAHICDFPIVLSKPVKVEPRG